MKHYVGAQLRSRLTAFAHALRALRKVPADVEALHDLRVAARRFLQALRLFGDFLNPRDARRMRRRIRTLMKHCGAVRNIDVTLELLRTASISDADLIAELSNRRRDLQTRMEAHLRRWRGDRSPKHWRSWLLPHRPSSQTWNDSRSAAENAPAVLARMSREYFEAGSAAAAAGGEHELHQFRLLGKRFRYSLELFADLYGPGAEARLRQLRRLQNSLGAINDCVVALELVQGHGQAEEVIRKLLASRRQEFLDHWPRFAKQRAAWQRWLEGARQDGTVSAETR